MIDRRRRPRPTTRIGFLEQLPTITLLDRMPLPVIAVGLEDGAIIYANPAIAELLGYPDSAALTAQSLPSLMADHELDRPRDCITALIAAAAIYLNHAEGFLVRTVVSRPFLRRRDDPVLLIGLTDTTELSWNNGFARTRPRPRPDETTPPALIA